MERRCIYRLAPHETDESNFTNEENKPERKTGSDLSETQTWHLNPEPSLLTSIATAVESGSLTGRGDLSFLATFYNEDSKTPLPKEVLGLQAKSLHLLPTPGSIVTPRSAEAANKDPRAKPIKEMAPLGRPEHNREQ